MMMKDGVRVLAVACAPAEKRRTLLVGVISRKDYIEGVVSTIVAVDGIDSTEKIAAMINKTRFRDQIRVLLLNGLGVAGLNILDVDKFEKLSSAKVLSITRRRPHPTLLIKALRAFSKQEKADVKGRVELMNRISKLKCFKAGGFYLQTNIDKESALRFSDYAFERVRLAHLIASGVSRGESVGRI